MKRDIVEDALKAIFVVVMLGIIFIFIMLSLMGCNTVKKTSQTHISTSDSTVIQSIDTIHVIRYDTSVLTREVYQTKVVEVYDTILTAHDSIITILKTRTIWTAGEKTEEKKGIHIDSSVGKVRVDTDVQKKDVRVETDKSSSRFPIGLIVWIVIGIVVIYLGYKFMTSPII